MGQKKSYSISSCRYCSSTKLTKILSLGNQPLADSFITQDQIKQEESFPLELFICNNCYLVQLGEVVFPEVMFGDYMYLSSSSKALKTHYAELASNLTKQFNLKKRDVVVDIGCNDGILLSGYKKSLTRIGVEPSSVAQVAIDAGFIVEQEFFDSKTARKIIKKHGNAKIVSTTNVFAHIDAIQNFVEGIAELLDKKGVFVIEAPYLIDMIDSLFFDTIYHEHLTYISLTPLVPFLQKFNLCVFDVERISLGASGPALRIYICKNGSYNINTSVNKLLKMELTWGIKKIATYRNFEKSVRKVKEKVLKLIDGLCTKGEIVGGYGAPAKGSTLLNYFDLKEKQIRWIAETNKLKQGKLTPGSHIPIISEEEFLVKNPKFALLLSWNYLDFFFKK